MFHSVPSDWPDHQWSEFHPIHGITWHVQRSGAAPGSHPTILLVHGTGGSTHSWAAITPILAPHAHVVNVDLPGHGFTHVSAAAARDHAPFTLPGMAQRLQALLAHLNVRPHVAVGHSAGVPVLLRLCIDGGIAPARLVGICPALVAPPTWYVTLLAPVLGLVLERDVVAESTARLAAGTRLIERMLASTGSPLTAEQGARYRFLCSRAEHVHAAISMMTRWDLPALFRDIGMLRVPVRLLAGRRDRWIPAASLARAVERIPGAQLAMAEGGHLLLEEHPEVVGREVLDATTG